ncbi:MAG: sodium:proton exchanger [Ignavibacteria bacterium]|nr:sodium:proton exchanger [Ignavibacteria bacterium]
MFLLLPILGATEPLSFKEIILKMLFAFGTLAGLLLLAKFLMPKIMYILAGIRLREAFTTGTILILLGTAYLTHSFGLSFALGAFIAGLILAESEYNSQIISDILPLKDTFNSIFFVSVGMLLNLELVLENPLFILIVTAAVIIFKSFIITIIVLFLRYPLRIALLTALGLSQIGEFAFVLSQAGSKTGLFDNQLYNIFLASSIFTMILAPFLIKLAPKLAFASSSLVPVRENGEDEETKNLTGQVVIAGFGLNGKNLARVLKQTGIRYIVTELNPDTVKIEKANNEKIIFGDISKEEVLHQVHIENASVLVFTISDPITTRRSLYTAKRINPKIFTVVRTRYLNEIEELKKLGADAVIPEEFETSLEIFRNVLERYHIPLNVIMQQTSILRSESYSLLRNDESAASFIHLDEILAQGLTETFFVNQDNPNAGRLLSEIHLREHSDATIIAIVRDGKTISNPTGKQKILINDTLVITGTHKSVDAAINILSGSAND